MLIKVSKNCFRSIVHSNHIRSEDALEDSFSDDGLPVNLLRGYEWINDSIQDTWIACIATQLLNNVT